MSDWRGIDIEIGVEDIEVGACIVTEATAEFSGYIDGTWNEGDVWIDFGEGPEKAVGRFRSAVLKAIHRDWIEEAFEEACRED